jgi:hypothetical protein
VDCGHLSCVLQPFITTWKELTYFETNAHYIDENGDIQEEKEKEKEKKTFMSPPQLLPCVPRPTVSSR